MHYVHSPFQEAHAEACKWNVSESEGCVRNQLHKRYIGYPLEELHDHEHTAQLGVCFIFVVKWPLILPLSARWTSLPFTYVDVDVVDWFHHKNWFGPPNFCPSNVIDECMWCVFLDVSSNTWPKVSLKIERRLMKNHRKCGKNMKKNYNCKQCVLSCLKQKPRLPELEPSTEKSEKIFHGRLEKRCCFFSKALGVE